MKRALLILISAVALVACGGKGTKVAENVVGSPIDKYKKYGLTGIAQDSLQFVVESNEKLSPEVLKMEDVSLNDLRFYGWEDKDWQENNYIRSIRLFLDYFSSDMLDAKLVEISEWTAFEKYKDDLKGRFVVLDGTSHMLGGLEYYVGMIDNPKIVVSCWVYSFVSNDGISGYDIRHFDVQEYNEPVITQEEIEGLKSGKIPLKLW